MSGAEPLHGNLRPPDDSASPAGDYLDGEVAARIFLSAVDRGIAGPGALAAAFRELLASHGCDIRPGHALCGFCATMQARLTPEADQ